MKKDAFTSKQACYLSACTSHQLRYWDKVGLVSPTIQSSNGKPGVPKLYSFRDIVSLRVIKTLLTTANNGATDTSLTVRRQFIGTCSSSGAVSFTAGSNETFAAFA